MRGGERDAAVTAPRAALARWISILLHPFVTVTVMVAAVGARVAGPGEAFRSVTLVGLIVLLPLGWLMVRQVKRGRWQNVDASDRRERPALYWAALAAMLALAAILVARDPASYLARGSLGVLAMLLLAAIATRWVKVSLHMAFATFAAVCLLMLGSLVGPILLFILPPLAWSRLALGRHRAPEVVLGTLLGGITGLGLFLV